MSSGSTPLPFDFDMRFPMPSKIVTWIMTSLKGTLFVLKCAVMTILATQRLMMSRFVIRTLLG